MRLQEHIGLTPASIAVEQHWRFVEIFCSWKTASLIWIDEALSLASLINYKKSFSLGIYPRQLDNQSSTVDRFCLGEVSSTMHALTYSSKHCLNRSNTTVDCGILTYGRYES